MTTPRPRSRPAASVRTRLVVAITLVAAIGLMAVGASVYFVERARVVASVDERLVDAAESARFLITDGPDGSGKWDSTWEALSAVVQRISPDDNTGAVGIVDGKVALLPGVPLDLDVSGNAEFIALAAEVGRRDAVSMETFDTGDRVWRFIAAPIVITPREGEPDTSVSVFALAYDVGGELSEINDAARAYLISAAICLAIITLVALIVSTRLLRPLRRMRETAERVSAQALSERLPVNGRDDVSELAATMNAMLDRLDDALESQRRLLSDVGHELKTPVTIVRGHLEVMDTSDPTDVRETVTLAVDELDRMAALVQDLAGAASLHGPAPITLSPVDLHELVAQIIRKASAVDGAIVTAAETATSVVQLDPARVTQAMLQLVQNAVTHGGGRVEIGSRVQGRRVELSVRDHGPGVPAEQATAVFERFNRGEAVGRGTKGSGLGLNIVLKIAEAHGGTVRVEDAAGGGARFVITLPTSPPVRIPPRPPLPPATATPDAHSADDRNEI